MKAMNYLARAVVATAALSIVCFAEAGDQKVGNSSKKLAMPVVASEEVRSFTVETGNGGSVEFLAPAARPKVAKKSLVQEEKWRSVTIECGNGGLLTFLVPNLQPTRMETQVLAKTTK
jgi:hypothetical protein